MTASPPPTTPGAGPTGTEAPPLTAFAWRHGLVRPVHGRTLAGVSGALARATNTDPVLWKVVLVVLTFFGGIGLLIYLLAWLLLPADGDTATPIEALGGRGQSRTSSARTIVGVVIAALALAGYISEPWRATPLLAMVLLGGVLLLLLRDQSRGRGPAAAPPPGSTPYAEAPTVPAPGSVGGPYASSPPAPPAGVAPPFAPQGPFAPSRAPMTPPPMPRWQPPPAPPRPRSRLGLLTLSVAVLLLGALAGADLYGFDVDPLAYLALPLAVLGLGLLVGTWVGRAHWLIALGVILATALGTGHAVMGKGFTSDEPFFGAMTLVPDSVDDLPTRVHRNVGSIEVDMSDVDFAGTTRSLDVRVGLGAIEITVPSDVDVDVDASVDLGSAEVFDESWDGIDSGPRTITDLGPDGPGGGELHITASVNTGDLQIRRA